MTKLEWCKANAPEALQSLEDTKLLEMMDSSYQRFCKNSTVEVTINGKELNECNNYMDYMVEILVATFGNLIAFKGGYMLTKLIPNCARQTSDIDFSIADSDLYKELINTMITIGEKFISEGYINHYTIKDTISKTMSGGMNMYDNNGKKVLGIDVGWHDLSFGLTTTTIDIGSVNAFSIERMLSDKITAILSRKRFRRPKDIYDLYCITNCFDFDCNKVYDYILKRTNGTGADWCNFPFNESTLIQYERAYMSLRLISITKGEELERPPFRNVIERFYTICNRLVNIGTEPIWNHNDFMFHVR